MDNYDLPRRRQQLTNLIQQYDVLKVQLEQSSADLLKISESARVTAIRDIGFAIESIRMEIRMIDERW